MRNDLKDWSEVDSQDHMTILNSGIYAFTFRLNTFRFLPT